MTKPERKLLKLIAALKPEDIRSRFVVTDWTDCTDIAQKINLIHFRNHGRAGYIGNPEQPMNVNPDMPMLYVGENNFKNDGTIVLTTESPAETIQVLDKIYRML